MAPQVVHRTVAALGLTSAPKQVGFAGTRLHLLQCMSLVRVRAWQAVVGDGLLQQPHVVALLGDEHDAEHGGDEDDRHCDVIE